MEAPLTSSIFGTMARRSRLNCPGMPFHVTARLQGRECLFLGIEQSVVRVIAETKERSDAQVLAYAVMPNHLHLIVVQGKKQLGAFMQVLLRRAALLVQRTHGREGHVFERRYHAAACADAEYFRTAIVYVHLNPVRAGVCSRPDDYPWTSHREYLIANEYRTWLTSAVVRGALPAFASRLTQTLGDWCADYHAFVEWRQVTDRAAVDSAFSLSTYAPNRPDTAPGDEHWMGGYGAAAGADRTVHGYRDDLRDIAVKTMALLAPDMDLALLCSGGRTRPLVAVRRELISRARLAGYRPTQIAHFLNVSTTAISHASGPR